MLSKVRESTETEGRRQIPNWQVSNEKIIAFIGLFVERYDIFVEHLQDTSWT